MPPKSNNQKKSLTKKASKKHGTKGSTKKTVASLVLKQSNTGTTKKAVAPLTSKPGKIGTAKKAGGKSNDKAKKQTVKSSAKKETKKTPKKEFKTLKSKANNPVAFFTLQPGKVDIGDIHVPLYNRLVEGASDKSRPYKDKKFKGPQNKYKKFKGPQTLSRKKQKGGNLNAKRKPGTRARPGIAIPPQHTHTPRRNWPPSLIKDRTDLNNKQVKEGLSPQFHGLVTEILHMVAHRHGGEETESNATAGSGHANTEDIAFETAADFYARLKHTNGQTLDPSIKVTHYYNEMTHALEYSRRKMYLRDANGIYRKVIDHIGDGQRGDIGAPEFNTLLSKMVNSHTTPYTNATFGPKTKLSAVA